MAESESAVLYQVDGALEYAVVYYMMTSPSFATHFLPYIKKELFSSEYAVLLLKLFIRRYKKLSKPPGGMSMAQAMVSQWHNLGKITKKVRNATYVYIAQCALEHDMEEEDCHEAFAEVVRMWIHHESTLEAMQLAMQQKPITAVMERIAIADTLATRKDTTFYYGPAGEPAPWIGLIKKSGHRHRLPTGVPEWDARMEGGIPREGMLIICSKTGGGKSKLLRQITASALLRGEDVCYISNEDPDAQVASDIYSAISGVPLKYTVMRPDAIAPYIVRNCRRLKTEPGNLYIEEYPMGITVTECLLQVDRNLEKIGKRPQFFVFDYVDRFSGGTKTHDSEYAAGGDIMQTLKNYLKKWKAWGASAVQAKRLIGKESYASQDENSIAGSIHKARIADVVINLVFRPSEDGGQEIASKFSKNRGGKAEGYTTQYAKVNYDYGTVLWSPDFNPIPLEKLAKDPAFADIVELQL